MTGDVLVFVDGPLRGEHRVEEVMHGTTLFEVRFEQADILISSSPFSNGPKPGGRPVAHEYRVRGREGAAVHAHFIATRSLAEAEARLRQAQREQAAEG